MNQKDTFKYSYMIAIGLVVLGLSLRFGGEKFLVDMYFKKYNDSPDKTTLNIVKYSGVVIYIVGWLIIVICLYMKHKDHKFLIQFLLSSVIINVVWTILEFREINFLLRPKLPLISVSVLLSSLTSLIILKSDLKDIILIIIASFLIVFTEYFILPLQRQYDIQDGVGLPLLILGWFILFYVFEDVKEVETLLAEKLPMININH